MQGGKAETVAALRQRVAALETQPVLAGPDALVPGGILATPAGALHEVFADSPADGGAAFGFALAQARRCLRPARPALLILGLKAEAQEAGLPYGLGLAPFGLAAEAVVLIRTDTVSELLWAMEEAIACRAVAAVVAGFVHPHRELDFTASRRLSLRAAASGATVLVVQHGRGRDASAARYRWHVLPAVSRPPPFDDRAPGRPRWRVRLEKGQLGGRRAGPGDEAMLVDLTEDGMVFADIGSPGGARTGSSGTTLPGAAPAALGHRLSQAG